jgi:hypothetical protein
MKIAAEVNTVESLKRGIDSGRTCVLEMDPASLTEVQRVALAGCCASSYPYRSRLEGVKADAYLVTESGGPLYLPEPTVAGVMEALREYAEMKVKVAAAKQEATRIAAQIQEGQVQAVLAAPLEDWLGPESGAPSWYATSHDYQTYSSTTSDHAVQRPHVMAYPRRLYLEPAQCADPRVVATRASAVAIALPEALAAWEAHYAAWQATCRAAASAKAEAEAMLVAAKTELVTRHGNESHRARHAEGLLSESEILGILRQTALGPVVEPLYERMDSMEIEHDGNCMDTTSVNCTIEPLATCDAETFIRITTIRARLAELGPGMRDALPGVETAVTLREHVCRCVQCDEAAARCGALVTVRWRGMEVSREYAL